MCKIVPCKPSKAYKYSVHVQFWKYWKNNSTPPRKKLWFFLGAETLSWLSQSSHSCHAPFWKNITHSWCSNLESCVLTFPQMNPTVTKLAFDWIIPRDNCWTKMSFRIRCHLCSEKLVFVVVSPYPWRSYICSEPVHRYSTKFLDICPKN